MSELHIPKIKALDCTKRGRALARIAHWNDVLDKGWVHLSEASERRVKLQKRIASRIVIRQSAGIGVLEVGGYSMGREFGRTVIDARIPQRFI